MKRREMMLSVRDLFESNRKIGDLGFSVGMIFYDEVDFVITGVTIIPTHSKSIEMLQNKLLDTIFGTSNIKEIFMELKPYSQGKEIELLVRFVEEGELLISSNEEPLVMNIFHDFLNYLDMASPREILEKMGHYRSEPDLDTDGE